MTSPLLLNRRRFVEGAAVLGLVASLPGAALAQTAPTNEQLMAPGALPDIWIGAADAPVTVIEYASMTCPHCAAFHQATYPALKSQYIDTGKVRFTLREFPFDPLATAGFMLARCAGPDKRTAMIDLLFAQQKNWAYSDKPLQGLSSLVKQTGMSQDTFETCLKDQKLYDDVNAVRDAGAKKFGVDATPTFFINGKKAAGEMSIDEMSKLFAPFLKS
jgi:protein-disulfide isomerase